VKLHYYGTQGTVANCFRSYLTNRKQKNWNKITGKTVIKIGNSKTWSSPGVNFGAFAFHNIHKWPTSNNKYFISVHFICWWY
jgi:hypothetical protein